MEGSVLALIGFLATAVVVAAALLWPRFRESLAFEDPVVAESVQTLHDLLDAESGPHAAAARGTEPLELRRERATWHARLQSEGVDPAVHTALDRI